jgi:Ca2+-binding EF-hand superfamily protein
MPLKPVFLEKHKPVDEASVDTLERMLRAKFELKSGFAEPGQLARTIHKALRALDTSDDEDMDVQRFATVMKKLNCGEDRGAVESLFHRYDTSDRSVVSMKDMADSVFGLKQVARSSAESRSVIQQIRDRLIARGETGYRRLSRALKQEAGSAQALAPQDLANVLSADGLNLTRGELATLFKSFDAKGTGKINVADFMVGLRPTISAQRLSLVKLTFLRLDRKERDGTIIFDSLVSLFSPERHPAVLEGSASPRDALRDFLSGWDKLGNEKVTEAEFIDFYKDLSAAIDNDQYFELMLRNSWRVSGGGGNGELSPSKGGFRVRVTHLDGTQSVERITDPDALTDLHPATLAEALRRQGASDILKVEAA